MNKFQEKFQKNFLNSTQMAINTLLVILTFFLVILLTKEIWLLAEIALFDKYSHNVYKEFLASLLTFFIYFEFVSMIIKYFKEDYHFPLRYFMYIGITATIRVIIVDHESGSDTLFFSLGILSLVLGYSVISGLSILKENLSDKKKTNSI